MTIAQIISLLIIYSIFSKDHLPGIAKSLRISLNIIREKHIGSLIIYTALTSLAIMAISLAQMADLLTVQNLSHSNIKFYTDIYVISRIVFFAGMIFIWPFLGEINIRRHNLNRKPFTKVISYFAAITLTAIITLFLFGDQLVHVLFGTNYDLHIIRDIGVLSVLYKFFLLVITAVIFYLVVLRSYIAVWFSIATSGAIFIFSEIVNKNSDIHTVLVGLNLITTISAIIGVTLAMYITIKERNNKVLTAT
jgi:O-antigen/teichoic acid export membrane protein